MPGTNLTATFEFCAADAHANFAKILASDGSAIFFLPRAHASPSKSL